MVRGYGEFDSDCLRLWRFIGHESALFNEALNEDGSLILRDEDIEIALSLIIGTLEPGALKSYLKEVFSYVQ